LPACPLPALQEAVEPAYGGEELAALRREVVRLGQAVGELARGQEALVGEMERAVVKREAIATKVSGQGSCGAAVMVGRQPME
jgi:hypothetical protein